MDEQKDQSKQIHPLATTNRVVVFDIDDTLCKYTFGGEEETRIKENNPECPILYDSDGREYIFPPHLQILFEYLLKHETRIVFFSGAHKKRNESLIPALLKFFWGTEKYEALRAKGQFNIFSDDDCREGKYRKEGEGNYVKDLKAVIRDGESLSDVILVDDDPSFVAYDQHPFLCALDLGSWYFYGHEEYIYKNSKNGVCYMLGLFKTAFEHEKYKNLALKEAFRQILPEKYYPTDATDSFKRNMMDIGLAEVQKQIPDARLFGTPLSDEEEDSA